MTLMEAVRLVLVHDPELGLVENQIDVSRGAVLNAPEFSGASRLMCNRLMCHTFHGEMAFLPRMITETTHSTHRPGTPLGQSNVPYVSWGNRVDAFFCPTGCPTGCRCHAFLHAGCRCHAFLHGCCRCHAFLHGWCWLLQVPCVSSLAVASAMRFFTVADSVAPPAGPVAPRGSCARIRRGTTSVELEQPR